MEYQLFYLQIRNINTSKVRMCVDLFNINFVPSLGRRHTIFASRVNAAFNFGKLINTLRLDDYIKPFKGGAGFTSGKHVRVMNTPLNPTFI